MAMTPEGRVKEAVKKRLRELGIWFYMPVQSGLGVVGIPDFICCWDSMFLAIETKAPGKTNNLTANQIQRIKEIHMAGGTAIVVDSLESLDTYLHVIKVTRRLEEKHGSE